MLALFMSGAARLYFGHREDAEDYRNMQAAGRCQGWLPLLWLAMFARDDSDREGQIYMATLTMARQRLALRRALLEELIEGVGTHLERWEQALDAELDARFVVLDLADTGALGSPTVIHAALGALDGEPGLELAALIKLSGLMALDADGQLEASDSELSQARLCGELDWQRVPCERFPSPPGGSPVTAPTQPATHKHASQRWILMHAGASAILAPLFVALAFRETSLWQGGMALLVAASAAYLAFTLLKARSRAATGYVLLGMTMIAYQLLQAFSGIEVSPLQLTPGACVWLGYWSMRDHLR